MPVRKRRALIHIGTEKTGSSSIQVGLQALRGTLPRLGFAYPRAPGGRNHIRLAVYAAGGEGINRGLLRQEERIGDRAGPIEAWLPAAMERELDALPAGVHTVLFSNEHCHSRVRTPEQVARLKALLDRFFDDYRVVVYLRRQDELAVSRYSTRLRTGSVDGGILPDRAEADAPYFDYAGLLDRWGGVFGRAALAPRIFARGELAEGDVVRDFLIRCGLPELRVPRQDGPTNPMLSAAAQDYLRRFNAVFAPPAGAARPRPLLRFVSARFGGAGRLPPRHEAAAFCGVFAAGNERVRREFFPDRDSLFCGDFGRYPERADPVAGASILEVARAVLAHLEAMPPERRRGRRPEGPATLEAARAVLADLAAEARPARVGGAAPAGLPAA